MFEIEAVKDNARAGRIRFENKILETPCFLPVATKGFVKTLLPNEAYDLGCKAIIVNALHVYRRAFSIVKDLGLHSFMKWPGVIFTDSGGFQSIKKFPAKITDYGVEFAMPDGTKDIFTPEKSIEIQDQLKSDLIFALDDCPSYPYTNERVKQSVERTILWAEKCQGNRHFAIIQGGLDAKMRKLCAKKLKSMDFFGFAIGGLCIGEPKNIMHDVVKLTIKELSADKPRHLMGVGSPDDISTCINYGVDIFDSAFPTRNARHGTLFTSRGKINLGKRKTSGSVIDPDCQCEACKNFSLDYLNYLFKEKETLGMRLATIHNLTFIQDYIKRIREEILNS